MKKIPLESLAFQLLKQNGFRVSKQYLQKRIVSHPHFPSLLSVSETFDTMKIANAVVQIPKDKFHEIPSPFMAHLITSGHETFELISNKTITHNSFSANNHSGVVLVVEKSEDLHFSEEHSRLLKKEHRRRKKFVAISLSLLTSLVISLLQYPSPILISAVVINLAGLIFSLFIQIEKLSGGNNLTAKFCSGDKGFDCNKIINSKTINFPAELDWGDLALIFFSGNLISIWISNLTGIFEWFLPVFALVSILPLPLTFISIYYRAYMLKQWCTLCLIIIALLWAQFALMFSVFTITSIPLNSLLYESMIFLAVICAWLVTKPELIAMNGLKTENLKLLRFKHNPIVFQSLLKKQPEVDTTRFNFDIQLGNSEADTKMLIVCGPYCQPCAQTHRILDELLEENQGTISMIVRLVGNFKNKEDKTTVAAERIVQTICSHPTPNNSTERNKKILSDWFLMMDQDQFNEKYPLDNPGNVDHILESYGQWAMQARISFTPAIFINGKLLPKEYSAHELKFLLANKGESPVP